MSTSYGSLSWFKKRTAYLNRQFGTSYRPTVLHSIFKNTGTIPPEFAQLPDPRSKSAAIGALYEKAFAESMRAQFRQLSRASNYVDSILDVMSFGNGYISANRRTVYTPAPDGNGWMVRASNRPDSSWNLVQSLPKGAVPLTPQYAYQLIKDYANKIHSRKKTNPHRGYKSYFE